MPIKMDLHEFARWLQENLPGERRLVMNRIETVFPADILQPGSFAALLAYMNGSELMICELAPTYLSAEEAWAALSSEEVYTFKAVPFYHWVQYQYWTAKKVKGESFIS